MIGVNSSIYTPSGGSIGLGFAIPINRARRVAEDLLAHGEVRRPWIGDQLRSTGRCDEPARRHQRRRGDRAASFPARRRRAAGLRAGDLIVRAGTATVRNRLRLGAARLDLRVGERVPLVVQRGGREHDGRRSRSRTCPR